MFSNAFSRYLGSTEFYLKPGAKLHGWVSTAYLLLYDESNNWQRVVSIKSYSHLKFLRIHKNGIKHNRRPIIIFLTGNYNPISKIELEFPCELVLYRNQHISFDNILPICLNRLLIVLVQLFCFFEEFSQPLFGSIFLRKQKNIAFLLNLIIFKKYGIFDFDPTISFYLVIFPFLEAELIQFLD